MKILIQKFLLGFLTLTLACTSGGGTEVTSPANPHKPKRVSHPCYHMTVDLPEGWDLVEFRPGDEVPFRDTATPEQTITMALLSREGGTRFEVYYTPEVEQSLEDFIATRHDPSDLRLIENVDGGAVGIANQATPFEETNYIFSFGFYLYLENEFGNAHILWTKAMVHADSPEKLEQIINEEFFDGIMGSLDFEPIECDLDTVLGL